MALRCLVYAGPTLARAQQIGRVAVDDVVVLPPVRRGDIDRVLRTSRTPGVIAVVDGYFHLQVLAVGHGELRRALAAGWQVWGLSSMGAIRAAEMHELGMHGWGRAFERYRDDPEFRDDEVSLLHDPDPPYRELSEPLLHMREGLDALVSNGDLAARDRDVIVENLMNRWFGDRTLTLVRELLRPHVGANTLHTWVASFDRFRVKAHDLADFLAQKPWLDAGRSGRSAE